MLINEFLSTWTPEAAYIDVDALKKRFSALRGLSKCRPDLSPEQLSEYANNVLITNKEQYESLAVIDPFKTYAETSDGDYHDTNSGEDINTTTDTQKHKNTNTYGSTSGTTTTPSGTQRQDTFQYAYNSTTANQPDTRVDTTYNNYKEIVDVKNGGTDTVTSEVESGNLETSFLHGHELDNTHHDAKSGYVLRDIVELSPKWVNIYDRVVSDIFSVIGVLIATRKIDMSLDW